jgi:hypothetical protein
MLEEVLHRRESGLAVVAADVYGRLTYVSRFAPNLWLNLEDELGTVGVTYAGTRPFAWCAVVGGSGAGDIGPLAEARRPL